MKWDPVRAVGLAFLKASEKLRQGGWSSGKARRKGEELHIVVSFRLLLGFVCRNWASGYNTMCGCWNSHEFWEPMVWSKLGQIRAWHKAERMPQICKLLHKMPCLLPGLLGPTSFPSVIKALQEGLGLWLWKISAVFLDVRWALCLSTLQPKPINQVWGLNLLLKQTHPLQSDTSQTFPLPKCQGS